MTARTYKRSKQVTTTYQLLTKTYKDGKGTVVENKTDNYFISHFLSPSKQLQVSSLLLALIMLPLAMESIAKTLQRPTRNHHYPDQHRELSRLRKNEPQQLEFDRVISFWDNKDDFFSPALVQIKLTYGNENHTPCPWRYETQHSFNHYPQYIHQVRCNSAQCQNFVAMGDCTCKEVGYQIPILNRTECNSATGEQHWEIAQTTVSAACVPLITQ